MSLMEVETGTCNKCEDPFPLTEEFFYQSKKSKTGFSSTCRKCTSRYYSKEARLERAQRRELALETEKPEVLSSFDVKALSQEVKKPVVVYSMDREISL